MCGANFDQTRTKQQAIALLQNFQSGWIIDKIERVGSGCIGFFGEGDEFYFVRSPAHESSGGFGGSIAASVPATELGVGDESESLFGYQFESDKLWCENTSEDFFK